MKFTSRAYNRGMRKALLSILGLVVIVGLIAAIIYSHEVEKRKEATRQANTELEKRNEATHQANTEEEASKHRITESEIDLIDLKLGRPKDGISADPFFVNGYHLTGRIRNP